MVEVFTFGPEPNVSVVIPTIPKNEHQTVLEHLKFQNGNFDYEVIIVNNSDLNICEARNKGIKQARSEIVALTDDDCRPPSEWLNRILEKYNRSDERLSCVEGAVEGGINYEGNRHYVGCNLTFNREDALEIGGFRSEYAGYRDDTEFGWRMEKKGLGKCVFDNSIRMNHPQRPRSTYNSTLDSKLKKEYPNRYQSIFLDDPIEKYHLKLCKMGLIGPLNRIFNKIRVFSSG